MLSWEKVHGIGIPGKSCSIDNVLRQFIDTTPQSIYEFAEAICNNVSENCSTVVAETGRISYKNDPLNDKLWNEEYYTMQRYIKNGSVVCSTLGLSFKVVEKEIKYEKSIGFPHFRTGNFNVRYVLTISGINKDTIMKKAEAIISEDNQLRIKSLREKCHDFYFRILDSDVVADVAEFFFKKIKDEINRGYRHSFTVETVNEFISITIDDGWDSRSYWRFAQNELEELCSDTQRIGFTLAVLDKLQEKFNKEPEFIFSKETDKEIINIKNIFVILPPVRTDLAKSCFEIVFQKTITNKLLKKWF